MWDTFSKKKGAVFEGNTGDVACDHYHRYKEDVALMKTLGVKSYRFSVSWSRVLPNGIGAVNGKGLDFYNRLLDELGKAGIAPMCTLFHWDYPEALYKRGGWLNRDSADWFAEYTALLADKLSDRVKLWVTQNEPQCFIGLGHLDGVHAPGDKLKFGDYLLAAHNGMRAHAKAVQALRAHAKDPKATKIGYVLSTQIAQPASDKPEDVAAARAAIVRGQRPPRMEQRLVDRSGGARQVPGGRRRRLRQGHAEVQAVRPGRDEAADRLPGPQHLQGRHLPARRRRQARARAVPPGYPRAGSDWQPITPGVAVLGAALLLRSLQAADVDHRKRPGDARPGVPGRQGPRPAAHRLHAPLPRSSCRARSRTACR